jgi:hypothetical protein
VTKDPGEVPALEIPALVRRAGTGRLPGGRRLTWTIADGHRGRRWRAITTSGDRLLHALLLEVAPDGSLARLEVSGPDGLLTLHPAHGAAGTLLGNVVRATGIEHVALPWSTSHILVLGASPVTAAVAAGSLRTRIGVGEGVSVPAIEIGDALQIRPATWRAARTAERRWRLLAADGGPSVLVQLDDDGVPAGLDDSLDWPLEVAADR